MIVQFFKKKMPWLKEYYHQFLIRRHRKYYIRHNGNLRDFFVKKYVKNFKCKPNFAKPTKLTEFVYIKMMNEHSLFEEKLSDKIYSKDYILKKGFSDYVVKTLKIFESVDDICFDGLPEKFVLKTNNDSGTVFLINKSKNTIMDKNHQLISFKKMKRLISNSLKGDYWLINFERQYKNIKPIIFAEEFLDTPEGSYITDYKFFVRKGIPLFLDVIYSREGGYDHDFYVDTAFNHVFISEENKGINVSQFKPRYFDKMIEFVKAITEGIDFVRVDLYYSDFFGIKFGEFTFTPAGGNGKREYPVDDGDIEAGIMIGLQYE